MSTEKPIILGDRTGAVSVTDSGTYSPSRSPSPDSTTDKESSLPAPPTDSNESPLPRIPYDELLADAIRTKKEALQAISESTEELQNAKANYNQQMSAIEQELEKEIGIGPKILAAIDEQIDARNEIVNEQEKNKKARAEYADSTKEEARIRIITEHNKDIKTLIQLLAERSRSEVTFDEDSLTFKFNKILFDENAKKLIEGRIAIEGFFAEGSFAITDNGQGAWELAITEPRGYNAEATKSYIKSQCREIAAGNLKEVVTIFAGQQTRGLYFPPGLDDKFKTELVRSGIFSTQDSFTIESDPEAKSYSKLVVTNPADYNNHAVDSLIAKTRDKTAIPSGDKRLLGKLSTVVEHIVAENYSGKSNGLDFFVGNDEQAKLVANQLVEQQIFVSQNDFVIVRQDGDMPYKIASKSEAARLIRDQDQSISGDPDKGIPSYAPISPIPNEAALDFFLKAEQLVEVDEAKQAHKAKWIKEILRDERDRKDTAREPRAVAFSLGVY